MKHTAYCETCGWVCPDSRPTEAAADEDGSDHEVEAGKAEPTHVHHQTKVRSGRG